MLSMDARLKNPAPRSYFGSGFSANYFTPSTSFYIMAGTNRAIGSAEADDIATLSKSDDAGPKYTSQVNRIRDQLKSYFPDSSIETFAYTRQTNEQIRQGNGAWGKAAVSTVYAAESLRSIYASLSLHSSSCADQDTTRYFSILVRRKTLMVQMSWTSPQVSPLLQYIYKLTRPPKNSGPTRNCPFGEPTKIRIRPPMYSFRSTSMPY